MSINKITTVFCVLLALGSLSWGATRSVPVGYLTIQDAIDASSPDGDIIVVSAGTYYENIDFNGKNITLRSTDPDDWDVVESTIIDGGGNGSVVTFSGTESVECVLSGFTICHGKAEKAESPDMEGNLHVGYTKTNCGGGISGGSEGVLGGSEMGEYHTEATIENCIIRDNTAAVYGGGIWGCGGRIENCKILDNMAKYYDPDVVATYGRGGGLSQCGRVENYYTPSVSPKIINCIISQNKAVVSGGGVFDIDLMEFCEITDNQIVDESPSLYYIHDKVGAGAHTGGRIRDSIISGNTIQPCSWSSPLGLGIYSIGGGVCGVIDFTGFHNSVLYLERCTVSSNSAGASGQDQEAGHVGGGVANVHAIINCTISDNEAAHDGGGLYSCQYVYRSVISGNSAGRYGGGVYSSDTCLINCTVVGNKAGPRFLTGLNFPPETHGGGVFLQSGGYIYILNNIVWNNCDFSYVDDMGTIAHCTSDIEIPAYAYLGCLSQNCFSEATGDNISITPPFIDAGGWLINEWEWTEGDYHLTENTMFVDKGIPAEFVPTLTVTYLTFPEDVPFDLDGNPISIRYYKSGPEMDYYNDLGAYELCSDSELYLQLDETSGQIMTDSSVFHRNGDLYGTPSWSSSGIINGCLSLDGIDDYGVISGYKGVTGGASRTCSAWVKTSGPVTANANMVVVEWGTYNVSGQQWILGVYSSGEFGAYLYGAAQNSVAKINDGQWHHIAAVLENDGSPTVGEIKLYLDGQLQTQTSGWGPSQIINTPEVHDVTVGACYFGATPIAFFNGLIDDVQVYSRALSSSEIAESALFGKQLHLQLDETSGQVMTDSSAFHRNGDLYGTPSWSSSGIINGCLSLDGTDDYGVIPGYKGVTGGASRTCAAWVKTSGPVTANANMVVVEWGTYNVSGQQWILGVYSSGEFGAYLYGAAQNSVAKINDGQWHHIAAVLENDGSPTVGEIKLYLDGQQIPTSGSGLSQIINTPEVHDVTVGACYFGATPIGFFNGLIDDVQVYSRALSSNEIAAFVP